MEVVMQASQAARVILQPHVLSVHMAVIQELQIIQAVPVVLVDREQAIPPWHLQVALAARMPALGVAVLAAILVQVAVLAVPQAAAVLVLAVPLMLLEKKVAVAELDCLV
jgi:hypothetical protein